jgi:hypothetical protein
MFYCNECAVKNDWPVTMFKSNGLCEICDTPKECNDLPSFMLPVPKRTEVRSITQKDFPVVISDDDKVFALDHLGQPEAMKVSSGQWMYPREVLERALGIYDG